MAQLSVVTVVIVGDISIYRIQSPEIVNRFTNQCEMRIEFQQENFLKI